MKAVVRSNKVETPGPLIEWVPPLDYPVPGCLVMGRIVGWLYLSLPAPASKQCVRPCIKYNTLGPTETACCEEQVQIRALLDWYRHHVTANGEAEHSCQRERRTIAGAL